jgi:hypothetical protein
MFKLFDHDDWAADHPAHDGLSDERMQSQRVRAMQKLLPAQASGDGALCAYVWIGESVCCQPNSLKVAPGLKQARNNLRFQCVQAGRVRLGPKECPKLAWDGRRILDPRRVLSGVFPEGLSFSPLLIVRLVEHQQRDQLGVCRQMRASLDL